jgi:chitinase
VYEGNENFTAALSSPTGATLGASAAIMTIADDEPVPQIGFTPAAVTVNENDAHATLYVTLSGLSATDCTMSYTTADGTAKDGSDYTASSDTLTIQAGDCSVTVDIPLLDNSVYEGSEAFTVTLSTPSGAVLGSKTATVTIEDNEAIPQLSFDPATLTVDESAAEAALTVTLSGETQEDVTVSYATADGTATGGSDLQKRQAP